MTTQTENAIQRYQRSLEKTLVKAPREVKTEAVQDANEFLNDEVRAMDVGRLTSEDAAYDRFVERFGTPEQLAAGYLEQSESPQAANRSFRRKQLAVATLLLAVMSSGVCYAVLREPPKLSPFTEVGFEDEQVIVTYNGQTCQWLGLDELKIDGIVASAKKQFRGRWQKRISEDLVEVLWGMNHRPGRTVKLRLLDVETKREFVVEDAPMTEKNRQAVYVKRLRAEDNPATSRQVDVNRAEPPKLSPFTEVSFEGEHVIVAYNGQTCQWLGLDELKVDDIVASAKKQFRGRWQKRVSEDLVEVLWGMNHKPGRTVKLRLLDLKTKRDFVVEDAPMTEKNRLAVYLKRLQVEDNPATNRQADANRAEPPKLSPFTEVSFKDEQVIVTYDNQNCRWLELDGLNVDDIVTSAKTQFGERWQKRISEDLVEVLWGMEHKPGRTVKLLLLDLKTKRDFVVENAPMTEKNRRAVYRKRLQAEDRR